MNNYSLIYLAIIVILISCSSDDYIVVQELEEIGAPEIFFKGADLSYVNEMEDCGATYFDENGLSVDPFTTISNRGGNIVRVRIWNDPSDFTTYSTIEDVEKTIQRAKTQNLKVLLDFHYSDRWADPGTQVTPAAWSGVQNNVEFLGDSLFNYTYNILKRLNDGNLLPDMVQVGNETNTEILQSEDEQGLTINWQRNSKLINKGIEAVRTASKDLGQDIKIMLHIAQPENALFWFKEAKDNGVTDFDWIGISYYPSPTNFGLNNLGDYENLGTAIELLREIHNKQVMIVETAYPFTLENADTANNVLGSGNLIEGYDATQQGQLDYLTKLIDVTKKAGGAGVIYWEPAWVSTDCTTLFGTGSNWDNATLYDDTGVPTLGMKFLSINTNL